MIKVNKSFVEYDREGRVRISTEIEVFEKDAKIACKKMNEYIKHMNK